MKNESMDNDGIREEQLLTETVRVDASRNIKETEGNEEKTFRADSTVRYAQTGNRAAVNEIDTDGTIRIEHWFNSGKKGIASSSEKENPENKDSNVPIKHIEFFELNGTNYKVIKPLSETTGEAQVYLLENIGNNVVLKLYYPSFSPKLDLLKVLNQMKNETIVTLYDYGMMKQGTSSRCFELMEYLEGGTLENFKLGQDEEQFKKITLTAAHSLYACHCNGIIHKDVKLSNFFFRDKEQKQLVLGDFGISSLKDGEEDLHRTTQARTPLYAAPEMYTNVINGEVELTSKVDFYSLGITLLNLWLGRNPFTGNERAMMRLKAEGKIPHLDELPADINKLIRGLTVINPEFRWGFEEIERWYKGEDVRVPENIPLLRYRKFIFDPEKELVASSAKELAALLLVDKQAGIRYLYNKRITKWLEESGNHKLSFSIDEIVEKYFPFDHSSGLVAAGFLLDPEQDFLPEYSLPTSTPEEIVKTFAEMKYTEDNLKALTDGRLLLWLSNKEYPLLYEEIKKLTEGEPYSQGLAYGVLYHLDRSVGLDLGSSYTSRERVGEIMSNALISAQDADNDAFLAALSEFINEKDKLYYYCKAHEWNDLLDFHEACFDLSSPENTESFGEYNIRIASYKFCISMGFTPRYFIKESKQMIKSVSEMEKLKDKYIKQEMRQGSLRYWLAIFYHENPFEKFGKEYSYEKTLKNYLLIVAKYNPTEHYSKRFITATDQQQDLLRQFKRVYRNSRIAENSWIFIFILSCLSLSFMIGHYSISNTDLYLERYYMGVCAPIAFCGLILFAMKALYGSSGFVSSLFTAIIGSALLTLPAWGTHWLMMSKPEPGEVIKYTQLLIAVYVVIALILGLKISTLKVRNLKTLGKEKIETSLLEPLYFAYKTTISKFRGSDDAAIEDGSVIMSNMRKEILTHYLLWSLLIGGFIIMFICYHPAFLDMAVPNVTWEGLKESLGITSVTDLENEYGL